MQKDCKYFDFCETYKWPEKSLGKLANNEINMNEITLFHPILWAYVAISDDNRKDDPHLVMKNKQYGIYAKRHN